MNDTAGPWAVEAQNLSYTYPGGVAALEEVTFRARPGEFVAVLGANGSGKTTLLKVLMRLLVPQAGTLRIDGHDPAGLRPAEVYRRIGMVFQNPTDQLFAPTVELDVGFGPRNLGLPEDQVAARVEQSLAMVDAAGLRHRAIHHLSLGQQKRACLAGVLAMRPSILLLDEPTAGLDPRAESQTAELLLGERRRSGTTLILCTHAVDLLPVLADRVCVLRQGRLWREGTPEEIFGDATTAAAAGLRPPWIAQLFQELLGQNGWPAGPLPLTVAEARRQILQRLAEGRGEK